MRRLSVLAGSLLVLMSGALAQESGSLASPRLRGMIGVGGVTERSARFRVQLDSPGDAAIELSTDRSFSHPIRGNASTASAARDYVILLDMSGLDADTRYYYRAEVNGTADQRAGTFVTFPPAGSTEAFTFAFGSCQQQGAGHSSNPPGKVFTQVVRAAPRFFLQLGDWGYPDTTDNLPSNVDVFSADYARVQGSYRSKFTDAYLMDTLLSTAPVDYVYDDHDYMNDNASANTVPLSIAIKPNSLSADFVARDIPVPGGTRENSIRGYLESMPTYPVQNATRGIYHSFRCGSAEFFMLDLRSQRSPTLEGFRVDETTGNWVYNPPPGHTILGRGAAPGSGESQLDWLLSGLRNSTATWKFLVSSVPFNKQLGGILELGILLQDSVFSDPRLPAGTRSIGASFDLADKWAGFPLDADTLLTFIKANRIRNVIVLSGDSHTAALDDGTDAGLPEIMAGGLDIPNSGEVAFLASLGLRIWNRGGQGLSTKVLNNAFGKVTVFGEDSVRLALVDENGTQFASYTLGNGVTGIAEPTVPGKEFRLEQNYPNPFNPTTVIAYNITAEVYVRLAVYDLLGREVAVLVDGRQGAGRHVVNFDARTLASGVYLYRLTAGGHVSSRKMLVLR